LTSGRARGLRSRAATGLSLVFLAALLWGAIGLITPGILAQGVSPMEIAFWRALLGGLFFVIHAVASGRMGLQRQGDAGRFLLFSLLGVSTFFASLVLAIDAGGTTLAFILLYSAPIWVLFGAWLLLGESLGRRKLGLALLAVLGIVLVSGAGGDGVNITPAAIAWGLLAGLSYSSYYIFGKAVLERYRPVTIYAWILPLGALPLLPLVTFAPKSATAWLLILLLAFMSTYLAYLLYYSGLAQVEASRAVLVATIEPVVAALLAAAFLGERLTAIGVIGAILVLAASTLASVPRRGAVDDPGTGR